MAMVSPGNHYQHIFHNENGATLVTTRTNRVAAKLVRPRDVINKQLNNSAVVLKNVYDIGGPSILSSFKSSQIPGKAYPAPSIRNRG
jgi:hypothetical protein